MNNNEITVAILLGGTSPERAVSKQSGLAIYEAVKKLGYNAKIIPILGVNRIGDLSETQENEIIENLPQESIIDIVDCVGVIPPKATFDQVPQ